MYIVHISFTQKTFLSPSPEENEKLDNLESFFKVANNTCRGDKFMKEKNQI